MLPFALAFTMLGTPVSAQDFHSLWVVPKKTQIGEATPIGAGTVSAGDRSWDFSIPVGRIPAGSYIEWDFTILADSDAPEFYAVEYFDEGAWKVKDTVKCSLTDNTTKEVTHELKTIRLENAIGRGNLQLRLRAVSDGKGMCRFPYADKTAASVRFLGTEAPRDTMRILCIGNSFTYVCGASFMLKEIAWSQGHYLDVQDALKGGQTFGQHLNLSETAYRIGLGGYEYVFFQNQSQTNAWYWQDRKGKKGIMDDALELAGRVRKFSPGACLVFEYTWAYPGLDNGGFASYKEFDTFLAKGTKKIAKAAEGVVSPIGRAFTICRNERPDIGLYADDDKHQNEYGAYLKACVNYLMIFGKPFDSNVQDCSLDPAKTAYLRSVAEKLVL